jgi:hypothetical protein
MGYITVSNQFGDMGKREIPKFSMAILIRKQVGFDPTNSRGCLEMIIASLLIILNGPQCP